ncbi:hypothetical protein GCM10028808_63410 [Spirosoma migulaei]
MRWYENRDGLRMGLVGQVEQGVFIKIFQICIVEWLISHCVEFKGKWFSFIGFAQQFRYKQVNGTDQSV